MEHINRDEEAIFKKIKGYKKKTLVSLIKKRDVLLVCVISTENGTGELSSNSGLTFALEKDTATFFQRY